MTHAAHIADEIKKSVSDILSRALAGYRDDFKYKSNGRSFIRWGAVEKAMHDEIDRHLTLGQEMGK
jgi:hypothetical protein